jgi:D-alanyl-D-alanine carboxypeptidase
MSLRIIAPVIVMAGAAAGFVWLEHEPDMVVTPDPTAIGTPTRLIVSTPEPTPEPRQNEAFIAPVVQPAYVPSRDVQAIDPVIDANAAAVYHLETERVLFSKNEAVRAPIASLTKVLTALVVHEHLAMEDIVTVTSGSVRVDEIRQTLNIGEKILVSDLVDLMLVESSNDAAYALAHHAELLGIDLVGRMNETAAELGMVDSMFTDPAGLDDEAYSTVNDLIRLVRAAVQVPALWDVMATSRVTISSVDGVFVHVASNTNELLGGLEGIVWGKTGNTDGALGCMLLIVKTPEESDTLVSIVLGSRSRFVDTEVLIGWAREAYTLP